MGLFAGEIIGGSYGSGRVDRFHCGDGDIWAVLAIYASWMARGELGGFEAFYIYISIDYRLRDETEIINIMRYDNLRLDIHYFSCYKKKSKKSIDANSRQPFFIL